MAIRHAYARNLPEAALIPERIEKAQERTAAMVQAHPTPADRPIAGKARAKTQIEVSPDETPMPPDLKALSSLVQGCRRCDLWKNATQGVTGEGPADAPL